MSEWGWNSIYSGLDRLGQAWENSNRYSEFDLAGTLSNMFRKKNKSPQYKLVEETAGPGNFQTGTGIVPNNTATPEIQNLLSNVGVSAGNLNIGPSVPNDPNTLNTLQSAGVYVPGASPQRTKAEFEEIKPPKDPNVFDISQLSATNPLRGVIPTNEGIVQRKVRPETIAAAMQWEQENKQNNLAQKLAQLEYDAKIGNYVTIDQATWDRIPDSYRSYYQVGQTIPRQELMGMIPKETISGGYDVVTAQDLAKGLYDKNPFKQALLNLQEGTDPAVIQDLVAKANAAQMSLDDLYKQSAGSDRGNTDLKNQYQGVLDSYQQYVNGLKARRSNGMVTPETTPLKLVDWLKQPNQKGALEIYNQFTRNNIQGFETPYNQKPGQKIQTNKTKIGYVQNADYDQGTWDKTGQIITQYGGTGKALISLLKNGGGDPKLLLALLDRYNQANKTNWTLKDFKKKFAK